jgi:hypothetical protein
MHVRESHRPKSRSGLWRVPRESLAQVPFAADIDGSTPLLQALERGK